MALDYTRHYDRALRRNVAEVRRAVAAGAAGDDLQVKVDRWADKFGFTPDEVRTQIRTNPMFACAFAKDPVKQGLHEHAAARYIAGMQPLVSRFEKLPAGGRGAVYLDLDGTVAVGAAAARRSGAKVKSLDFTFLCGTTRVYCLHKWTKDEGGGQDHQHSEALRFLAAARHRDRSSPREGDPVGGDGLVATHFVAVCDGPYYTDERVAGAAGTRQRRIDVMAETVADVAHVHATDINGLAAVLAGLYRS